MSTLVYTVPPLPSHAVRARRFFFDGEITFSIVLVGTRAECKAFIADSDDSIYCTEHNEATRWRLKVVTTNSLRLYARIEAERWNSANNGRYID